MAKRTKKVGPAGRYQARYGVKARTIIRNVEIQQRAKYNCPSCGHKKVKRVSTSIWQCKKCNVKFAGGAYFPKTEAGQNVDRALRGEGEPEIVAPTPEKIEKESEK